ncbi:hypothetical protein ABT061_15870 [Streptosporangium sp. NPDC002544]|uniref:hypothetical protein n=1 Tax=Streptosporangium sp. NPDC002544 TaxID=3154538 RepID=UPI003326E49E
MREITMLKIGSYAKAITSALAAGTAALVTAMGDGVIVQGEWVTVALAVLGALGITYVVPNAAQSDPPAGAARGPYPMA